MLLLKSSWRWSRLLSIPLILLWGSAISLARDTVTNVQSLGPGGGGGVFAAAFHNIDPNIILLGQDVGGIDKSTDGGLTWRHVNSEGFARSELTLNVFVLDQLLAHPTDNDLFFASSSSGLFRSRDVGETWEMVIPAPGAEEILVSWIEFSPLDPNLGLVGTGGWHEPEPGVGIYRTTDAGTTFVKVAAAGVPETATITSIAFDPDDGTVCASTSSGLFQSTDNGDSFSKLAFEFRHDQGQWVGIGGSGTSKVFWYVLYTLGTDEDLSSRSAGVYRSTDGASWTEITGYPTINDAESNELMRPVGAVVMPGTASILLLNLRTDGGEGGLHRYDGSWTTLSDTFVDDTWSAGSGFFGTAPECIQVNQSDPNIIISCNEKAVFKSSDGGASWAQISIQEVGTDRWTGTGTEVLATYDTAYSNGVLYVAYEDAGFWRSDDRGASWKQLLWPGATPDTLRPDGATEIAVHPSDPDRFYVALGSFSNDYRENVRSEIQKSTNGGTTTTDVTPPSSATLLGRPVLNVGWGASSTEDTLFAAFHGDSIYKSTDGGTTWSEISAGFSADDLKTIYEIAADPSSPDTIYAGLNTFFSAFTGSGGLYRSTDGGSNWTKLVNYPYQDIGTLRFAGSPGLLFVGGWTEGDGGLRTTEDGSTFTEVLDQPYVTDITDAPGTTGILYAASSATFVRGTGQNAGIYRSTDNGTTWARLNGNLQMTRIWDITTFPDQPNLLFLSSDGDGILSVTIDDATATEAAFTITDRSGRSLLTAGDGNDVLVGYARIQPGSGSTTPSGVAIFGFRQGGVLVSEAGVPASGLIQSGRIYAEVAGPVNTGLAIANPNDSAAEISFFFTDSSGVDFGAGSLTLAANAQTAKFLDQDPFDPGTSVEGSFTFTSSVPIAVIALRGFTNRRSEFLMTTLPVASLTPAVVDTIYFPHFADGSGWTTQVVLVNPTDETISGMIEFLGTGSGETPATGVTLALTDGRMGSEFAYSIPERSSVKVQTSNPSGGGTSVGSVRVTRGSGSSSPVGLGIFSLETNGITVSEAGVPALDTSSGFRMYVEVSGTPGEIGSLRSGLAVTNTALTTTTVLLELTELDGSATGLSSSLDLPPSGQVARFVDELFPTLTTPFQGVLRITTTPDPVASIGLRLRINERGEILTTTTPPSDEAAATTSAELLFPHIVDTGGWTTQFVLFSGVAGQSSSGSMTFVSQSGAALGLTVR